MELFTKLGIDWRLLIFQVVNFGILLFLLWRFLYQPLLKILEKRREKIEEGLVFARDIEKKMSEVKEESERQIRHAKNQAQVIADKATKDAEKIKSELMEESKAQAGLLLDRAQNEIAAERERALADIRKEAGEVVMMAVEKVLKKKIDAKKDRALIQETLKQL